MFLATNPALDKQSPIGVGGPRGSKTKGLSTGRATVDWDNRFEHSFSHFTPFFEGGLANTVPDSAFFTRPYTSLGGVSHLEQGANFHLLRRVSVGGSAYQVVPFGHQKGISRLAKQKGTAITGTSNQPHLDTPG